jgi:uncharacterized protein (DUF305 family)
LPSAKRRSILNNDIRRFAIPLILILAVTLAAWRQDSHAHSNMIMAGPDWSQLAGSMDRMDAAMASVAPSGNSDVDFVHMMLPHHQAAIDMAKAQLLYGKDPQMRRLAQEIITDQQSEIELMQLWLKQHRPTSGKVDQTPSPAANKEQ